MCTQRSIGTVLMLCQLRHQGSVDGESNSDSNPISHLINSLEPGFEAEQFTERDSNT